MRANAFAFVSLQFNDDLFAAGYRLAQTAYGRSIERALGEVLKLLELDAKYRALCIEDLLIEDSKTLRKGLERLRQPQRALRKDPRPSAAKA